MLIVNRVAENGHSSAVSIRHSAHREHDGDVMFKMVDAHYNYFNKHHWFGTYGYDSSGGRGAYVLGVRMTAYGFEANVGSEMSGVYVSRR